MVAFSPEVEKLGLVLPSRNGPHSGWPNLAQPVPDRARSSISVQPSFLPGQPSASAIGRGMAMTSGEAAIFGTSGGTSLGRSADSCQPRASAAMASPDALEVTWTCTQRPSADGLVAA